MFISRSRRGSRENILSSEGLDEKEEDEEDLEEEEEDEEKEEKGEEKGKEKGKKKGKEKIKGKGKRGGERKGVLGEEEELNYWLHVSVSTRYKKYNQCRAILGEMYPLTRERFIYKQCTYCIEYLLKNY